MSKQAKSFRLNPRLVDELEDAVEKSGESLTGFVEVALARELQRRRQPPFTISLFSREALDNIAAMLESSPPSLNPMNPDEVADIDALKAISLSDLFDD